MFPVWKIAGIEIAMYGLLAIVGFAVSTWVAVFRGKQYGVAREDVFYAILFGGVGLAVGAKLLYLITILPVMLENWGWLLQNPKEFVGLISGGFVFYGGLLGGIGGIYLYTRKYKLDFFAIVETILPVIPLFHMFGRLGCFFAGCCYGTPYPPPIGLYFNASPVAPHDVALFPVQLVEAGLNLILFVFLLCYCAKPRKRGVSLGIYLLCYTAMRFFLEFVRGDAERGVWAGISTSQWISLALLPVAIWLIVRREKREEGN